MVGPSYPLRGGLATFNERLARQFIKEGHKVKIITFSLQYPGFLFPGKTQYSPDPAPEDLDIEVKVNSINPFNWLKVGLQLKKAKPDLIITRFWLPFMGPSLGTIARLAKNKHTKILAIIDNMIPHEKRPGDRMLSKYFVKSIEGFVVMSRSVKEDMKQFISSKQQVLYRPHPIYDNFGPIANREESLKRLALAPSNKYLLFFGFIRDYKGLDLLLKAMADERIKKMNLKAIVAGEFYANEQKYQDLIDELDIRSQLILRTEYIPSEDVRFFFGAADVVVQPYKSATQSGISQMAYHFEIPMIVTKVGGLPEIVPDNKVGFVTDVDAQAVADAIVNYYSQNKESDFRKGVKETKGLYSWENFTEAIYQLAED